MNNSKTRFWSWQGLQVAWKLDGSTLEQPIATVLVHGFGGCKEHWRYNQKIIGDIAPSYSIDLIGFGESSQPKSCLKQELNTQEGFLYCFDNWSQQIIDFCNQVVKKPVILIGNSIGCVIALKASEEIISGCKGLILIDCATRTMDDKRLSEQSLLMRLSRPVMKTLVKRRWLSENLFKGLTNTSFIKSILKLAYPTGSNINEELIDILYKPTQREGASEAFRGFINLFDDHLAPKLMENSKLNIDLIWGENDPWESLEEAQSWLKQYQCIRSLHIIPNAGHCPHDETPEQVNDLLIQIIQAAK